MAGGGGKKNHTWRVSAVPFSLANVLPVMPRMATALTLTLTISQRVAASLRLISCWGVIHWERRRILSRFVDYFCMNAKCLLCVAFIFIQRVQLILQKMSCATLRRDWKQSSGLSEDKVILMTVIKIISVWDSIFDSGVDSYQAEGV